MKTTWFLSGSLLFDAGIFLRRINLKPELPATPAYQAVLIIRREGKQTPLSL
jgi:hypothetical protein